MNRQELSCFLFNPYAIRCPSSAYYLGHFRVVELGSWAECLADGSERGGHYSPT